MEVRGRNLLTGLPKNIKISSDEMLEAMEEPLYQITETIHSVLERTPPELAADIGGDKGDTNDWWRSFTIWYGQADNLKDRDRGSYCR